MPDPASLITAPGVDPAFGALLVAVSFVTSLTTAALSLGGGAIMIALLSLVWPAAVALPVHGVIQLGSNVGRAFHRRADIQWGYLVWFAMGAAIGSIVGGSVATSLPDTVFRGLVGLFLIYAAWGPTPSERVTTPLQIAIGGTITSAVGMIVGATGPFVAGMLRGFDDRRKIVGTHAALMSLQHVFKIAAFGFLGFQFGPYLGLTAAMIASGFAGTLVGGRLLDRLPERIFRIAFRIVLTLVALDLIRRAVTGG